MRIHGGTATLLAATVLAGCGSLPSGRDRVVKAPATCQDQTVHIYFDAYSAQVTREGQAVLRQAAAAAKGCRVQSVEVLGLADAVGAPDANLELSKKRADSVTSALARAGLPAAEFKVAAAGQAGATTASGEARPLRRRADVTLRLASPK